MVTTLTAAPPGSSEGAVLVNGSLDQSPVTRDPGRLAPQRHRRRRDAGCGSDVGIGLLADPGRGMGAPGTLTVSNHLTQTGGVLNHFDLSADPAGPSNDLVSVRGDLHLSGINTIHIRPLDGALAYGTYPLIHYSGNLEGGAANLEVPDIPGYSFILLEEPGLLSVRVTENRVAEPVTLVGASAVWRYHDLPQELDTQWRTIGYGDGAWESGPPELGFGDGDETTLVTDNNQWTVYFRHAFYVPAAHLVDTLEARLKRDDGAVVYLNGTEVWRSNMPAERLTTPLPPVPPPPMPRNAPGTPTPSHPRPWSMAGTCWPRRYTRSSFPAPTLPSTSSWTGPSFPWSPPCSASRWKRKTGSCAGPPTPPNLPCTGHLTSLDPPAGRQSASHPWSATAIG